MTKNTNIEAVYPLSPMQQGMLFHSLRDPQSGQYFIQVSCALNGQINAEAFEQAWQQVVARHSILRTAFVWKGLDRMLQVVGRTVKVPFITEDWQHLGEQAQQQRLSALLDEDRRRGFELSRAPLMRLALIGLGQSRYQFLWSYHHLILDGWSMPIVFRDIVACYNALTRGESLNLPPAPPYREYIDWLQRQNLADAERFWREYLRGFDAATRLPSDSTSSADAAGRPDDYAEARIRLSAGATQSLQSLARQRHVTLNTIAQGAWAILLHSYAGCDDVVFGSTVACRPAELANAQAIVGLFINTLPVRVR
ncbi:MAG TPA: condensation domain-containing protein, partial [Burkholderiaceae bacterium]|nr:condensation domain-containing protein [Burkholderiaceae bacterium]